jgi:hypothetical protein
MTRREEFGVCYAHAFDDGSYIMDRSHYDALKRAWMKGEAFYEGVGLYGQLVTLKLSRIEGVSDFSPEQIAAYDADQAEQSRQDMLQGDG